MATIQVTSLTGKGASSVSLPGDLFGQEVNPRLLAHVARIANWRTIRGKTAGGKTKTRSEVTMTTAKLYRQKGTGRARHGAKSAPIFVGGGIAHGPTGLKRNLVMPRKMAHAALISALSARAKDKNLIVIDVSKNSDGKTKNITRLFEKAGVKGKRALVLHSYEEGVVKAARNIPGIDLIPAKMATAYSVLTHPYLVITSGGLDALSATFGGKTKKENK